MSPRFTVSYKASEVPGLKKRAGQRSISNYFRSLDGVPELVHGGPRERTDLKLQASEKTEGAKRKRR